MNRHELNFGAAQIQITPFSSLPLAGFAYRKNEPFTTIESDIFVKAFAFLAAERTACIVVADILWWAPEHISSIRTFAANTWGINPEDLLLHATHTHCAPQTSSGFTPGLGILNEEWQQRLLDALFESINVAMDSLRPAHFTKFHGSSAVSMNRRVDKGVDPTSPEWPAGEIDRELTTLVVNDQHGAPLGALIHFSCHPTILRGAILSAEFPGVTCNLIADYLGGDCIVGYLQGCCGDIGPVTESEDQAPDVTRNEMRRIGTQLAEDVIGSLNSDSENIEPDAISGSLHTVPLTFESVPSPGELAQESARPDYIGDWARHLLANTQQRLVDHVLLEIQHFRLGTNLNILTFNAEMVSHYGLLAKQTSNDTTLCCGYSNGMLGYVVTDSQLRNGGYEVDESTKYFGLPSRFAPEIQQKIDESIIEILAPTP